MVNKKNGLSGGKTGVKLRKVRIIHHKRSWTVQTGAGEKYVLPPYGNQKTSDMLDASRIITAYIKNGKLEDVSSSDSVKKIVARAIKDKKVTETALALQKLNHAIVVRNAQENVPTDETKLLYAKLIHED